VTVATVPSMSVPPSAHGDVGVFVAGRGRRRRCRQVVDVGDGQRDRRGRRQRAVGDRVAEAVAAVEVRRRRVGEGAVRRERDRAALRRGERARDRRDAVAVDVEVGARAGVVGEDVAADGRVLGGGVAVGDRRRGVVHRRDGDHLVGRRAGAAVVVGDGERDRDRAVEVRGGREDEVGRLGCRDRRARDDRRRAVGQIEDAFACRWKRRHRDRRNRAVDVRAAERDRDVGVFVAAEVDAVAVGRSLTSTTVITSLAGALVPPSLSVTVKAIVTVPLKFAAGVKMRRRGLRSRDRRARDNRRRAVGEVEHAFAGWRQLT
jgi:hypothetical protein